MFWPRAKGGSIWRKSGTYTSSDVEIIPIIPVLPKILPNALIAITVAKGPNIPGPDDPANWFITKNMTARLLLADGNWRSKAGVVKRSRHW